MEKDALLKLIASPTELGEKLEQTKTLFNREDWSYYEPENHDVHNPEKRKKKEIQKPSGRKNQQGQDILVADWQEVARVSVPAQKLIVSRAATFTAGAPVELRANPETEAEKKLLKMVRKVWIDNKLDYKNLPLAEAMMSQREVAELWYFEAPKGNYWKELAPAGAKRMRMITVKPSEGNKLFPQFDAMRDMVGFCRIYEVGEGDDKEKWLDVYTDETYHYFREEKSQWVVREVDDERLTKNLLGKIPVIYFFQERSEWQDVDSIIKRLEELLSNHADINDYNGSPALVAEGKVLGFSSKGERGKAFEMEKGSKLSYLSWDHAPESIRMEIENLINAIYTYTQTPNISFEAVKGIGAQSGVSIKLLFMDAHSKARRKQCSTYGEGIQRRINLIKAGCVKINPALAEAEAMDIWPEFQDYMPTNEVEDAQVESAKVNTLMRANGGQPIVSLESSVNISPLPVEDPQEELKKVQDHIEEQALIEEERRKPVLV